MHSELDYMKKILFFLALLCLIGTASAATWDFNYHVDQTQAIAYKTCNVIGALTQSPNNFQIAYYEYTLPEKYLVSDTNDANFVVGAGTGFGGLDCAGYPPIHDWVSTCEGRTVSNCDGWGFTNGSFSTPCRWLTGACHAYGQACNCYSISKFVFKTINKEYITSVNFTFKTKVTAMGNPASIQRVNLYAYNNSTSAWDYLTQGTQSGQTTICTTIYNLTNPTNYINAQGQITVALIEADTDGLRVMNVYFAQADVTYVIPNPFFKAKGLKIKGIKIW